MHLWASLSPSSPQAKLWEDNKDRKSSRTGTVLPTALANLEGRLSRSSLMSNLEGKLSWSSQTSNPASLPSISYKESTGRRESVESVSSFDSNMNRFSSCLEPSQQSSLGARAPRPLGVPRYQLSLASKTQETIPEESATDLTLPLPVLPTEEVMRKEGERRSRKISQSVPPPIGAFGKLPPINPPDLTVAKVEKAVEPALPPSPHGACEDDASGSVDSFDLDLCLEELAKSPHFERYLKLLQVEAITGTKVTRAFTFSYFDLY